MRVSCGVPPEFAPPNLLDEIALLGVQPIITSRIIRVVYEGNDIKLGEAIVALYEKIPGSDRTVFYDKGKEERRHERKQERARAHEDRMHGRHRKRR